MLQTNTAIKKAALAQRYQNHMGHGIIVSNAYTYWISMNAGSCSDCGSPRTSLPIHVLLYDFRSHVNEVGRPAAIFSRRRTEIRTWYESCHIAYGSDDQSVIE